MPEFLGIKRYVQHGGDEIVAAIESAETLDQLQNAIKSNLTLVGKIRSFCMRDNTPPLLSIVQDIGAKWEEFVDDILDDEEFSQFQNFMRGLTERQEQRNVISMVLNSYFELTTEYRNLKLGELVKPSYPNATVEIPENLRLPSIQYSIDKYGGIWKKKSLITRGGLIITKRINIIADGKVAYEIAFQNDIGEWKTAKIAGEFLLDSKKFNPFAGQGIQISTSTAKQAMEYLSVLAQANGMTIPTAIGTSHLGWVEGNLLTNTHNPNVEVIADVTLQPTIKAIASQGTLQEWIDNVFLVALEDFTNAPFLIGFLTSLSSMFLEPAGLPNGWFVHYYGESRSGKSTTMKAIVSTLGVSKHNGLWRSWNNTKVFVERYSHFMSGLSGYFDEARVEDKATIQELVYLIANGMGRGRGTPGGIAETLTWNINIVSTGEFDLREVANQEGFENRMITYPSKGKTFFKGRSDVAKKLEDNVVLYHGTLFPAYAPYVEAMGQEEIKAQIVEARQILLETLNGEVDPELLQSGKANTFIDYFSVMAVAFELFLDKILVLEDDQEEKIVLLFYNEFIRFIIELLEERESREEKVLDSVISMIASNLGKFYDENRDSNREPPLGWMGKVIQQTTESIIIGVKPEVIKDYLNRRNLSLGEFERLAEETETLVKEVDGSKSRIKSNIKLNGMSVRMYKLKMKK